MGLCIGDKFGFFVVEKESKSQIYGGRITRFWWCKCQICNRDELVSERKLLYEPCDGRQSMDRCSVCRRGPCVICGGEIVQKTRSNTCGASCKKLKLQGLQNKSYSKRSLEDPLFNKKRYLAVVEKMEKDPDYALQVKKIRQNANRRYLNQPEKKEKIIEYQSKRYRDNKIIIQAQRQKFWDSLTVEEKEFIRERNRGYYRDYQRRYQKWLKDNPKEYQDFIARQREYQNEYNRQKELASFMAASHKLKDKLNNDE